MRFFLAYSRDAHTAFVNYMEFEVAGFAHGQEYCYEVLDHPPLAWSLECTDPASDQPITSQVIDVAENGAGTGDDVMVGTVEPIIDAVEVDLAEGGTVEADVVRDVAGLDRDVWVSPAPADQIAVVRALAADGSEVRRIVVEDGDDYLVLERGDRGPSVLQWQRELNFVTGAGIAEDGIFGENTVTATANFQAFFGLRVDGVVGPTTRDVMDLVLAAI